MPPLIDPQVIASLLQNAPQGGQQQGPLPPTNPVQPQAGVPLPGTGMAAQGGSPMPQQQPLDPQQIGAQAMQQGMQQTTQQLNRANTLSNQAMQLSQSPYSTPDPKYGFRPNFEQGQGVGGFFHNLGQALLTLGAATRPGQAVQDVVYGPDIRARQAEIASRAAEIGTIEKGAEQAQQATGPLAKMGPAYMGAEARGVSAQAAADRAKAYTESVKNRMDIATKGLDLKALQTGSQVEMNKFRERLMDMQTKLGPERLELEKYGIDANNATRLTAANLIAQLGIDKTHPVAQMIDSILGTSLVPAAPQTTGGAAPVSGATPPPPRTPPAASKTTPKGGGQQFHYDKNGNRVAGQ